MDLSAAAALEIAAKQLRIVAYSNLSRDIPMGQGYASCFIFFNCR